MKINIKHFGALLLLLIPMTTLHINCKKDKPANPLIFISPEELQLFAEADDVIFFDISATSEAGLASFKITSKLDNGSSFTMTELEEALSSVGTYSKLFEMVAPAAAAGVSVILTFTATDVDGLQTSTLRRLWVTELPTGPAYLSETSGHVVYSRNSGSADSYNLKTGVPGYSTLVDSTERDIEDNTLSDTTMTLSRSWVSPAGGKFVRFNSFNYPNATDSLLVDAYNSGTKFNKINNLEVGDIILTKLGSTSKVKYLALKLTQISDLDSTDQDFYMFSVKN